ncbi:hypothetical protein NL108_018021 [Boleophthalmus pectinirostris]|uniref:stonustoxin subunit beta-like n=1 Tax=Boleophthalmus pectinirostris TaxID=150288 RepID=UPI0024302928|nr:stonustoxin subunit beta-like [Boleophthalmus pectinirostris]KAJ0057776.1 hypothetical protein NL108_018021 [Boleophthalmus pectinirostris]
MAQKELDQEVVFCSDENPDQRPHQGSDQRLYQVLPPPDESSSREDFLQYSTEITLDPNSVHTQVLLSDGNRVTFRREHQSYPDHPDRFSDREQVLSIESLEGRCYWEVEWSGMWGVSTAVSYREIQRKGDSDECGFGYNDKSWALYSDETSYSFLFNKAEFEFSGSVGSRIGVYLDHSAGVLEFYSVSGGTVRLLHRVQTRFTQPLYAGVGLYCYGDTAHFPKLK